MLVSEDHLWKPHLWNGFKPLGFSLWAYCPRNSFCLCLSTHGRHWLRLCQAGWELGPAAEAAKRLHWRDLYSPALVNTLHGVCGHYILSGILQVKRNSQADSTVAVCFTRTTWDGLSQQRGQKNKNACNKKIKELIQQLKKLFRENLEERERRFIYIEITVLSLGKLD